MAANLDEYRELHYDREMHEAPNISGVGQGGTRAERTAIEGNLVSPESYRKNADAVQVDEIARRAAEGHIGKYPPGRNASAAPAFASGEHLISIADYERQNPLPIETPPPVVGLDEHGTLGINLDPPR